MSEQRLIDANALLDKQESLYMKRNVLFHGITAFAVENAPTIDPETLPIVQELKGKLEQMTAERDAAVKQLHGYCAACKNYTQSHCDGPCEECEHEYYIYRTSDARDNWEWCGPEHAWFGYRRIEMEIQNDG